MKNQMARFSIDQESRQAIKDAVRCSFKGLEDALNEAEKKYDSWRGALPAETSLLNHHLTFLQFIEETSGNFTIKEDWKVVQEVLKGTGILDVGSIFKKGNRQGNEKEWKVIWRKIGPRYAIEMGIESEDREIDSVEFYD